MPVARGKLDEAERLVAKRVVGATRVETRPGRSRSTLDPGRSQGLFATSGGQSPPTWAATSPRDSAQAARASPYVTHVRSWSRSERKRSKNGPIPNSHRDDELPGKKNPQAIDPRALLAGPQ
jgi:hypothetical protein